MVLGGSVDVEVEDVSLNTAPAATVVAAAAVVVVVVVVARVVEESSITHEVPLILKPESQLAQSAESCVAHNAPVVPVFKSGNPGYRVGMPLFLERCGRSSTGKECLEFRDAVVGGAAAGVA